MTRTGILIELENNRVKETSLGIMAAARGTEVFALVMTEDLSQVTETLARYGATAIVGVKGDFSKSPDLGALALADLIRAHELTALLGTASAQGKDLFARLATLMDQPLVSDCLEVNLAEKTVKKSHFSGKTLATLKVDAPIFLCTIRPNLYDPQEAPAPGDVLEFTPEAKGPDLTRIVETRAGDTGTMDLTEAPVVISGGRAVGSTQNFAMLEACAKKLGGAVGASRAAVDAGYCPHAMQVGQTGKTVSPRLYIACGVSGAVQHFAGMKTSKVIVAVNEDKDAPIFSKSDYGIVGDIFEVIPKLTDKL